MKQESNEEDFLWTCALQNPQQPRRWLVPDYEDDMSHFVQRQEEARAISDADLHSSTQRNYRLSIISGLMESAVEVKVLEHRGNGVLDIIGGELWQAALLLTSLIVREWDTLKDASILELGSGVGLPGLLAAVMKAKYGHAGAVCLSDNDPRVLQTLSLSIEQQFKGMISPNAPFCETNLRVVAMDWSSFFYLPEEDGASVPNSSLLVDVDVLIGAALCYAPYHAQCLAHVIECFFSCAEDKRSNRRVIILQMHQREGFEQLVQLLRCSTLPLCVTLQEVDDKLYARAQSISCSQPRMSFASGRGYDDAEEVEVMVERCFRIPIHEAALIKEHEQLLTADRDLFTLLTVHWDCGAV